MDIKSTEDSWVTCHYIHLTLTILTHSFAVQIVERRGPMVPIVVVGNKSELADRVITREQAEAVAVYDWECGYVECSAKENQNIVQVFKELLVQAKV